MTLQRDAVLIAVSAAFAWACTTSGTDDGSGHGGGGGDQGGAAGEVAGVGGDGGAAGEAQGGISGNEGGSGGDGGQGNATGGSGGNATGGSGGSATGGSGGSATGGSGGSAASGGTGGTPVAVPCAQRPYCNDFESVSAGARPAGTADVSAGNTLQVVTDKASSGQKSLYIAASSGGARFSFTIADGKLTNPKKVTYLRMKLWMDNLPGGVAPGHWDVMGIDGLARTDENQIYGAGVRFGGARDSSTMLLYVGGGADCAKGDNKPLPLQKWLCVEMRLDETNAKPYGVSVDGVAIPGLQMTVAENGGFCSSIGTPFGSWYVPDGKTFWIGWKHYHPQGKAVKLWIDDVVVDEQPIGCL